MCEDIVRVVAAFLIVIFFVVGTLMDVGAPSAVVFGAATLLTFAFLWFMVNWLGAAVGEAIGPIQPRLRPGPSPVEIVLQPVLVLGGLVVFGLLSLVFVMMDAAMRGAILSGLGQVAVAVLQVFGVIGHWLLSTLVDAVRSFGGR
jgi:hypothetical protein